MQKSVLWKKHSLVLFNPHIGPLSGTTIPGQSGPGSDGIKGVLRIPQSSSITGNSPSDFFSVISRTLVGGVLPLCREAVSVFYSPSRLGNHFLSLWYDSTWDWTQVSRTISEHSTHSTNGLVELLILDWNIWDHINVCKQIINEWKLLP